MDKEDSSSKRRNWDLPVTIIADPAYPLKPWIMKPYSGRGNLTAAQVRFNYRLSRARMTIENSFGRLKGKMALFAKGLGSFIISVKSVGKRTMTDGILREAMKLMFYLTMVIMQRLAKRFEMILLQHLQIICCEMINKWNLINTLFLLWLLRE